MRGVVLRFVSLLFGLLLPFLVSCSGSGSSSASAPAELVPVIASSGSWSDPKIWGGTKPTAGQLAVIPQGVAVTLDEDPPQLGGVQVDGTLTVARRNTNLRTGWITVSGKLEVGSETDPFIQRAVITLNGRPGSDLQGREGGIWANGGTVDLHGETGKISWARLAQTATAGTNRLVLQAPPGWRPGDRIVIASTDFDMNQAEEKTVAAVAGNVLTLGSPLVYTHWGATENGVEVRAEVGLLSRNIIIQGDEASLQNGKGGHLLAKAGSTIRISGVEFSRMGRKGELARYPVHFHMMGEAAGSYVKESAIHHSFNRAVSVHGSHNTVVQGNVAYDVMGHSYILEDGIETGNLLENNLGLVTRRPPAGSRVLESDANPATFWITNPDNIVRGNAAAGSDRFGFWYDLPVHPTGPSATDAVFPRHLPFGEFADNVAHSNWDGLFVDVLSEFGIYEPRLGGNPAGEPVSASFTALTAYKNRNRGFWVRATPTDMTGFKLADNAIGGTLVNTTDALGRNLLNNSVVVGETSNLGNPQALEVKGLDGRSLPQPLESSFPIRGFEIYDGLVGVENVTFTNFLPNSQRPASALSDLRHNRFGLNTGNYVRGISFTNANQVYFDPFGTNPQRPNEEDGHRSALFIDADGSVTGMAGQVVVINNPFLLGGACTLVNSWNAYVCSQNYGRLTIENTTANTAEIAPLKVVREDNSVVQTLAGEPGQPRRKFQTNTLDRLSYAIGFNATVPQMLRFTYRFRQGGDWIQLAVPYPYALFKVYRDGDFSTPLIRVNSVAEVGAGAGNVYFYDTVSQALHLKLMVRSDVPGRDFAKLDIVP